MSQNLQTELNIYMSYLDTLIPPVAVDEMMRPPTPVVPTPRSTWRGLAVAVGTALATLLLVGGVAWLAPLNGDSSPADEPTVLTTISSAPEPTSDTVTGPEPTSDSSTGPEPTSDTMPMTWAKAEWAEGQGPFVFDIVGTPSGLLGTGRTGGLWRSTDGASWEPTLTHLNDITVVSSGLEVLAAGVRDDSTVLLRSSDGISWTEIDLSGLPLDQQAVVATTPSGLTWFASRAAGGSGAGVLAVVSDGRITEVHDPPWDPEACCGVTELLEVGGHIAAYQFDRNEPQFSHQWEYLGQGEWSEARDVTFGQHAVVGDTALRVDKTNSTCCGSPIPGTSFWPLLSSSDGINWTEIVQMPAENTHSLHVAAGSSFWIYGPNLRGGGPGIEVHPDTAVEISKDGLTWQRIDFSPVDVPFFAEPQTGVIHVAGSTIFMSNETAWEGTGEYWVGTVNTGWDG